MDDLDANETDSFGRNIIRDRDDSDSRRHAISNTQAIRTEVAEYSSSSSSGGKTYKPYDRRYNDKPDGMANRDVVRGDYNIQRYNNSNSNSFKSNRQSYQDKYRSNKGGVNQYPQDPNRGGGSGGGGGGGGGRSYHNTMSGLPPAQQHKNASIMRPLLSYKNFSALQTEMTHDMCRNAYNEISLKYVKDLSDNYFHASKFEEWFEERYNPMKIVDTEVETAAWAAKSSAVFLEDLIANAVDVVKETSLDYAAGLARSKLLATLKLSDKSTAASALNAGNKADTSVEVASPVTKGDETQPLIYGCHIPGHEDRTIYIRGVSSSCPKSVLINSILVALASPDNDIATPDRILTSQAIWNKYGKLERNAWIVMQSTEDARKAIKILKEHIVQVPEPALPETAPSDTTPIKLSFPLYAKFHSTSDRIITALPVRNDPLHIEADLIDSLELASLMDELREVPAESCIKSILELPQVLSALVKSTDKLDLIIAYLRRVHFVSFYSALRYRNESHLLTQCPTVFYRQTVSIKDDDSKTAVDKESEVVVDAVAAVAAVAAPIVEDDATTTTADEKKIDEAAAVDVDDKAAIAAVEPASAVVSKSYSDISITNMIAALRGKLESRRSGKVDYAIPGTIDEEEAKKLTEIQDKSFDEMMFKQCIAEQEGKMRCCYKSCGKLFKNDSFLRKHIKSKHEVFCKEVLIRNAESYMRGRYEAENITHRPLPPVRVEHYGKIETKSVREIIEKIRSSPVAVQQQSPHPKQQQQRMSQQGEKRKSMSDNSSPAVSSRPPLPTYMDIDAPKEQVVSIEYGVAILPPAKKRKLIKKS